MVMVQAMPSAERDTYRHGDLQSAAISAAYEMVAASGHEKLSVRKVAERTGVAHRSLYNHFVDRDDLLNHVAAEGYRRLAAELVSAIDARTFIRIYVVFALGERSIYSLMTSRPHVTMSKHPPLQSAVHLVITEAMRVFARPGEDASARRRTVMKMYMLLFGGITFHSMGILDVDGEASLVDELVAMTAAPAGS